MYYSLRSKETRSGMCGLKRVHKNVADGLQHIRPIFPVLKAPPDKRANFLAQIFSSITINGYTTLFHVSF